MALPGPSWGGCQLGFRGFLLPPAPSLQSLLLQLPDHIPEHLPHEHSKIAASHITHKLWCELLVNEDLI